MKLLSLNYKSWAKSSLYETFKVCKFLNSAFDDRFGELLRHFPSSWDIFEPKHGIILDAHGLSYKITELVLSSCLCE